MIEYAGIDITNPLIVLGGFIIIHRLWFGKSSTRNIVGLSMMIFASVASLVSWGLTSLFFIYLIGFNRKGLRGSYTRNISGIKLTAILSIPITIGMFLWLNQVDLFGIGGSVLFIGAAIYNRKTLQKRAASERFYTGQLRQDILKRDKYRCVNPKCRSKKDLQIDHIKPFSQGGKTTYENGQTLCKTCNTSKGAKSQLQWKLSR